MGQFQFVAFSGHSVTILIAAKAARLGEKNNPTKAYLSWG